MRASSLCISQAGTHFCFREVFQTEAEMSTTKPVIQVVAAIITDGSRILATQRGYGDFKGMWEFPGGKIEPGELPEEALRREIREELQIEIAISRFLSKVNYEYPGFILNMDCYLSKIESGTLVLAEHQDARWLAPSELMTVEWLPADIEIVEQLCSISLCS